MYRASRTIKEGLSRCFLGYGSKPWVPSTSAGGLRELLSVPLRSQGYPGVGRALSGLHWVWCNRREPHLEWRQEPQGSSPFLTLIAGSLQSWDRRVRPRLVRKNGPPLASRVIHGVTGNLSNCVWNLRVFPDDARGFSAPSCCAFFHRVVFEEVSGHRVLIKSGPGNRGLSACVTTHEATSQIFSLDWPHPEVRREGWEPLPYKARESTLQSQSGGEKWLR